MTGFSPTQQVAETCAYYRKFAAEQCGWTPQPDDMGINRHVYVAETDAKARAVADEFMNDYYHTSTTTTEERQAIRALDVARNTERSFSYKAAAHVGRPSMDVVDCDRLVREGFCIVGSPDSVIRQIKEQERITGAGRLVMYLPWGDMSLAQADKSLELFAREVLPHL
jgi:alkanesulfonate monooxygenase SsuD/methylene tetrahydromethanopterin reductase-like flavin-dependent oxidoreductase (luciferase family)